MYALTRTITQNKPIQHPLTSSALSGMTFLRKTKELVESAPERVVLGFAA
jgi:hypothetical protein